MKCLLIARVFGSFSHSRHLLLSLVLMYPLLAANAAITPGVLYAWGNNSSGQLNVPSNLGSVIGISAGRLHSLAIQTDGKVVSWGNHVDTRLNVPTGLPAIAAVAAGGTHSLALGTNGAVYGWGDDAYGQHKPPATLGTVAAIAAGDTHSLALKINGVVVAWGNNDRGQAPLNLNLSGIIAIAAGEGHSLALRSAGGVVGWGDNSFGQISIPNLGAAVAIAAGTSHSLALRSDGKVFAWGDNSFGQSSVPSNLGSVLAIAAGGNCSLALLANHTVRVWGETTFSQLSVPSDLVNGLKLAGGAYHCLAIRVDPPVISTQPQGLSVLIGSSATFSVIATGSPPLTYQWKFSGTNIPGAIGTSYAVGSTKATDAGSYTVVLANSAGTVTSSNAVLIVREPPVITQQPVGKTVGLGSSTSLEAAAIGASPLSYRWRKNQTPLSAGVASLLSLGSVQLGDAGNYDVVITNRYGSVTSSVAVLEVKPLPAILRFPASLEAFPGTTVSLSVVATNADSYQWYKNNQIIAGAVRPSLVFSPVLPADLGSYRVTALNGYGEAASSAASLTLSVPEVFSQVVGWGESQIWNGSRFVEVSPPIGLSGIVQLAAGASHSLALKKIGTVLCWGENSFGQALAPSDLTGVTAIAAGDGFSLALTGLGKIVAWGRSDESQIAVPSPLTDAVVIVAGKSHSLALRSGGGVVAWGSNHEGESSLPLGLGRAKGIAAGEDFSLVLLTNGTVVGWGKNDFGQRRPPAGLSNVIGLVAGRAHALALRSDGSVIAWGDNVFSQTDVPVFAHSVTALAAGEDHSIALLSNGEVVVWGKNNAGQLNPPTDLQRTVFLAAAADHCLVLRQRGVQFQPIQVAPNGTLRLQLVSTDGTPIDAARAARVRIYSSPSLLLPFSSWTQLPAPALTDTGALRTIETPPVGSAAKFFRAVEDAL